MIYAGILETCKMPINESFAEYELLSQNIQLCIEYCCASMEITNEVYIPDEAKNKQKHSLLDSLKQLVDRLWKSFRMWCKDLKTKLVEKISKVKTKKDTKDDNKSGGSDKKEEPKEQEQKYASLNDKFDKVDEKKLMSEDILDLTSCIRNYDKELFENYDNAAYAATVTKNVTNGLYESIDDLKADDLIGESSQKPDISKLNELSKKFDAMISEVDAYFNALQDSIRKAEAKYKDMSTTDYTDSNISAKVGNPLEYMRMKKVLQASVKMIGVQSGIVRNIVYVKVAAINKVIESAAKA